VEEGLRALREGMDAAAMDVRREAGSSEAFGRGTHENAVNP